MKANGLALSAIFLFMLASPTAFARTASYIPSFNVTNNIGVEILHAKRVGLRIYKVCSNLQPIHHRPMFAFGVGFTYSLFKVP